MKKISLRASREINYTLPWLEDEKLSLASFGHLRGAHRVALICAVARKGKNKKKERKVNANCFDLFFTDEANEQKKLCIFWLLRCLGHFVKIPTTCLMKLMYQRDFFPPNSNIAGTVFSYAEGIIFLMVAYEVTKIGYSCIFPISSNFYIKKFLISKQILLNIEKKKTAILHSFIKKRSNFLVTERKRKAHKTVATLLSRGNKHRSDKPI